jgi:hypothetical protein
MEESRASIFSESALEKLGYLENCTCGVMRAHSVCQCVRSAVLTFFVLELAELQGINL